MLRWLFTLLLVVVVLGLLAPSASRRWRLGWLPGDVSLRLRGRTFHFPFATTILLSLLFTLVLRWG